MRGACVEGLDGRSTGAVGALVGAVLAVAAGCKSSFSGPYECAAGYASCVNPSQNACETDTATDGLNCGACGMACAVGAPCLASSCGQAAVRITQTGSSTLLKTNASAVFWSSGNLSSAVYSLPLSAAAGTAGAAIVTDGANLGNGRASFAVDDANLYYLSLITGTSTGCPSGGCADLVQVSLANGARTVLVPWSALSTLLSNAGIPVGNGAGGNVGAALAVGGSNVYFLVSLQSNNTVAYALGDAMIGGAGQAGKLLAKTNGTNGPPHADLAANDTVVAFESWDNGATSLHLVPVGGGSMRTVPLGGGFTGPIAADASNIYAIASGCSCFDNNQSIVGPPPGAVTRVPVGGGAVQTVAKFWGETGGLAVDSANVYWSTDTAAWKVGVAGGTSTPVAGNLTNGAAAYQCNGCGGGSQTEPTSIALGPSALYVAATAAGAILKVAK